MTRALRTRVLCAGWTAGLLWTACSAPESGARAKHSGPLADGVIAQVDGTEITLAEVERLAQRGSLTPSAALARLEAEALLAAEAERRGYAVLPPVDEVTEQARVQALLQGDVEVVVPTEAEIDAAYAANAERFHTQEQRASSHVLARVAKDATPEQDQAARAFATEAVRRLRAAADPLAGLEEFKTASPETGRVAFEIKVEVLPAVAKTGAFVSEFSQALFELPKVGSISDPVRTQFGWHAIVLREIIPEQHVPDEVARQELRNELTHQKRQQRFDQLVRALQSRTRVSYGADIKRALATLEF